MDIVCKLQQRSTTARRSDTKFTLHVHSGEQHVLKTYLANIGQDWPTIIQTTSGSDPAERGSVLIWAARDRNSSRMASEGSHAKFIETPDSEKTEGQLATAYGIEHPILFLLRQKGEKEKGWRDAVFYWPVIRAQKHTPTAIYAADTIGD